MDELNNGTLTAAQRMRRLYWERKNNGLCTRCGKANKDGKAYCPECRAGRNEWRRQDRIFYAAHGLCTCCGKNIVFGEDRTCFECRAKDCVRRGRRDSDGMRKKKQRGLPAALPGAFGTGVMRRLWQAQGGRREKEVRNVCPEGYRTEHEELLEEKGRVRRHPKK